jgi:hypothetical protein
MAKMKGSTKSKKSTGRSVSAVSPLPFLARGEDKGEGLELTHVTLLGLTLTLPLTEGEASQARMQPIFTYRSAN